MLASVQYRIWLGDGSKHEIDVLKSKIVEQEKQNELLVSENSKLKKEVQALRTNPKLLEEKARENLGLIKPGETFYRVIPKEN